MRHGIKRKRYYIKEKIFYKVSKHDIKKKGILQSK